MFHCFLILVAHHAVFVIKAVIGTGIISPVEKTVHLVLVKVHHTDIAVIIVIINVIRTGLTVR